MEWGCGVTQGCSGASRAALGWCWEEEEESLPPCLGGVRGCHIPVGLWPSLALSNPVDLGSQDAPKVTQSQV